MQSRPPSISDDLWELLLAPKSIAKILFDEDQEDHICWSRSSFLFNLLLVSKTFKALVDTDYCWKLILGISVFKLQKYLTSESKIRIRNISSGLLRKLRNHPQVHSLDSQTLLLVCTPNFIPTETAYEPGPEKPKTDTETRVEYQKVPMWHFVVSFLWYPLPDLQFVNLPVIDHDFGEDVIFHRKPLISPVQASEFEEIESIKGKAKFLAVKAAAQCSSYVGERKLLLDILQAFNLEGITLTRMAPPASLRMYLARQKYLDQFCPMPAQYLTPGCSRRRYRT
jgi:hypothetical protein